MAITAYTPQTYKTTDYGNTLKLAEKAGSTLSTPQYQTPEALSKTTQSVYSSLDPIKRTTNASINQQYNTSQRALADHLAATGYQKSGGVDRTAFSGMEMGRNTALANNNSNLWAQALTAAQQQQQTALNERSMLQGQAQNAFANSMAGNQAQASENQYGANLANTQQNTLLAQQQAAGNEIYQQQALAEQIAARQASNALSTADLTGIAPNGQQTLASQQFANAQAQQALQNQYTQAGITGLFNGQQTEPARQAQTSAQQAAINAYLNYQLGTAEQTGSLPVIQGFNWGDYLKQLSAGQVTNIA